MDLKKKDLKQSHFVKLNHIAEVSSKDTGLMSQSTEMLRSSQDSNSEQMELFQMSSLEDTPASLSASQVVKEAKKTKDISGQKCIDLYESCGLDGSFARMLVDTLNSVSTKFSLHWRLKDTPAGRLLFQRAVSMPRTKGTGSGLWLTPTAVQTDEHPDKMRKRMEKYPNGTTVGSLTSQVKYAPLWPTPTAMSGGENVAPSHRDGTHGWNTGAAVKDSLSENPVRTWPTPTAMSGGAPKSRFMGSSETDGQLNPEWVEWLMGFPIGHTELKLWGTQSSRKSRKSSGEQ